MTFCSNFVVALGFHALDEVITQWFQVDEGYNGS